MAHAKEQKGDCTNFIDDIDIKVFWVESYMIHRRFYNLFFRTAGDGFSMGRWVSLLHLNGNGMGIYQDPLVIGAEQRMIIAWASRFDFLSASHGSRKSMPMRILRRSDMPPLFGSCPPNQP